MASTCHLYADSSAARKLLGARRLDFDSHEQMIVELFAAAGLIRRLIIPGKGRYNRRSRYLNLHHAFQSVPLISGDRFGACPWSIAYTIDETGSNTSTDALFQGIRSIKEESRARIGMNKLHLHATRAAATPTPVPTGDHLRDVYGTFIFASRKVVEIAPGAFLANSN